jgi:hypothetical protein
MVRTSMAPCACSRILASTTTQDTVHSESGWSDDLTYWCRLAMASGEVVGRRPLVLPTSSYRINSIASAGKLVLFRCVLVVPSTRRRPFLYIYVHHHLKPHGAALRWSCRPIRFLDRMSISRTSKTHPFGLEKRGCDAARQATPAQPLSRNPRPPFARRWRGGLYGHLSVSHSLVPSKTPVMVSHVVATASHVVTTSWQQPLDCQSPLNACLLASCEANSVVHASRYWGI